MQNSCKNESNLTFGDNKRSNTYTHTTIISYLKICWKLSQYTNGYGNLNTIEIIPLEMIYTVSRANNADFK